MQYVQMMEADLTNEEDFHLLETEHLRLEDKSFEKEKKEGAAADKAESKEAGDD